MAIKQHIKQVIWVIAIAIIGMMAWPVGAQEPGREIDPNDINLPDDYRIEAVISNLSIPTTAIFDGEDLLIAESGYKDTALPRVLRIRPDGSVEVEASEGLRPPVTGLLVVNESLYVSHRGKVSVVEDGRLRDIVTDLPSEGDHQNNQLALGPDGSNYELVAWGLRNPFGLSFDQNGQLWATNHGADVRGSRTIFNDPDYLVRAEQNAWYGWPEYFDGAPRR